VSANICLIRAFRLWGADGYLHLRQPGRPNLGDVFATGNVGAWRHPDRVHLHAARHGAARWHDGREQQPWAPGATYNAANQPLHDGTATRDYNSLLQPLLGGLVIDKTSRALPIVAIEGFDVVSE
jgi:hypothetical protein